MSTNATPILGALLGASLLTACFSKEPVAEVHYFRPELEALEVSSRVANQRPLRFKTVSSPAELGSQMLWRVSATELVPDSLSFWARRPEELLDERLRDHFFGDGGFRSSLRTGDPELEVRLVTFEGDLHEGSQAVVELIVTLLDGDGFEYRGRVSVVEPLEAQTAEALATAMGRALSAAAAQTEAWVLSNW